LEGFIRGQDQRQAITTARTSNPPTTLAAQLSLAQGTLSLYEEIPQHAVRLELEVASCAARGRNWRIA